MKFSFKRVLIVVIPAIILTIVAFYFINRESGDSGSGPGDYVRLSEAKYSVSGSVKSRTSFKALKSVWNWCFTDGECGIVSYAGNPWEGSGCSANVPVRAELREFVASSPGLFFKEVSSGPTGSACGAPLYNIKGVECRNMTCQLVRD